MAINSVFVTLAGNAKVWDDEILAKCRGGKYPGTYNSDDLCRVQLDQYARGRAEVTIWKNVYGWAVGYVSNLNDRMVVAGGRAEPGLTKEQIIERGIAWVNVNPDLRSLTVLRSDLLGTKWEVK